MKTKQVEFFHFLIIEQMMSSSYHQLIDILKVKRNKKTLFFCFACHMSDDDFLALVGLVRGAYKDRDFFAELSLSENDSSHLLFFPSKEVGKVGISFENAGPPEIGWRKLYIEIFPNEQDNMDKEMEFRSFILRILAGMITK